MPIVATKKHSSRRYDSWLTLYTGTTSVVAPTTTLTMKEALPISCPSASAPLPARTALKVENRSGAPLPRASNVTPARLSGKRSSWESVLMLGEKYSEADTPSHTNSRASQAAINASTVPCRVLYVQ
ncbi:hypothetical protein GGI06_001055 [Coemansia sp. S85]|nr:hypothetical protein GGI06_001055 [Coemansia sp. S85]